MTNSPDDAFFRHICVHAGVALIATDAQLRIRFWNQAATRLFGGSPEAMQGELLTTIVPADRRSIAERLLQRALARHEASTFEFPHRAPDGTPMFLAVSVSPVIDDTGQSTGVSVYIRDVTRRIESERALTEATKMAALGSMAGAIAHHFNNVLGGLVTSADFAQSSDDPDMLRRVLKSIVGTLSRASGLTQALLAFAEGDHSDGELADIGETVRRFIESVEPKFKRCGIRVEMHIEPVNLRTPARRLRTILDCLTANACEAMPQGGTLRIEVGVSPNATEVLLRISDTGVGMTELELRHAFEPFFTTKCEGTPGSTEHPGLGLPVVHGIVRSLGGTVTLASIPNEGTCCTVHLPLTGQSEA